MPSERVEKNKESEMRISTGVPGLDEILHHGLVARRVYLVRGGPGTGKSTVGLHFLTNGATAGENVLFITLGEPEEQVRENAASLSFDLKGVSFLDLTPSSEFFTESQSYDIFSPAEVERGATTEKIKGEIERLKPSRVFVDSATQFRYLTTDAFQFRKQMLALSRYLTEQGATVLLCSEGSTEAPDDDLQFLSDGVISLDFPTTGRTVSVTKFRGSGFQSGQHSLRLGSSGMEVFPRLIPGAYHRDFVVESLTFGVPELDKMLHGGLERGTVTIISGPAGVGKTTLGLQFLREAAGRGERSVVYSFEEGRETMLRRCDGIKMPVRSMLEKGTLSVMEIEPLYYTTDEFAYLVRREVEENNTRIIMLDSTAGYQLSLASKDLASHLNALCRYLKNMGVTAILISEVESITGEFRATEAGISYLADNVIFLRYVETAGELRRTIGILEKRTSDFDKNLCEFEITRRGIRVGKTLTMMGGILGGVGLMRSLMGGGSR
ncbi:MAG: ATPase domain-containing protein [Chloroflexota bacterium]